MKYYKTDNNGNLESIDIYSAEELSKKVYDSIKYYQDNYLKVIDNMKKSKEEIKAEVNNEYEEENKHLRSSIIVI